MQRNLVHEHSCEISLPQQHRFLFLLIWCTWNLQTHNCPSPVNTTNYPSCTYQVVDYSPCLSPTADAYSKFFLPISLPLNPLPHPLSLSFWAAAQKGRCPVGHRGEFPDVRTYVRTSVRPPEASQASNSHWIAWEIVKMQTSHWIIDNLQKSKKCMFPIE